MGFFEHQSRPNLPPLVEPPHAGQEIVLDEEEQQLVDGRITQFLEQDAMKKRIFPEVVIRTLQDALAAEALTALAEKRLNEGKLKEAASACLKALGLHSGIDSVRAWKLLARANWEYGDYVRARNLLDGAMHAVNELQKSNSLSDTYTESLRSEIRALRQQFERGK